MGTFDFTFAIKFVSDNAGGDNFFDLTQTGDSMLMWIGFALAIIAACANVIFLVRRRRYAMAKANSEVQAIKPKGQFMLVLMAIVALAMACMAFVGSGTASAVAEGSQTGVPVIKAKILEDGNFEIKPIHLRNTKDTQIKVKSSATELEGDAYSDGVMQTSIFRTLGLGGTVYEGNPNGAVYITHDAYNRIQPGEVGEFNINIAGVGIDTAKAFENQIVYISQITFEDAVVPVPEPAENLVYNGKYQQGVKSDEHRYEMVDDAPDSVIKAQDVKVNKTTGEVEPYITTLQLNPGFVWDDETDDNIDIEWTIQPATLDVFGFEASKNYDTKPLIGKYEIKGLCDREFIDETEDEPVSTFVPEYVGTTPTAITHYYQTYDPETDDYTGVINNPHVEFVTTSPEDKTPAIETNYKVVNHFGTLMINQIKYMNFEAPDQTYEFDGQLHGEHVKVSTLEDSLHIDDPNVAIIFRYGGIHEDTEIIGRPFQRRNVLDSTNVRYSVKSFYNVDGNYNVGDYYDENGTYNFEIAPLDVRLNWTGDTEKTYDTLTFPEQHWTFTPNYDSDQVSYELNWEIQKAGQRVENPVDAGQYNAVVLGFNGEEYYTANYKLPEFGLEKDLTINPRQMSRTVDHYMVILSGDISGKASEYNKGWAYHNLFPYEGHAINPTWGVQIGRIPEPLTITIDRKITVYPNTDDFVLSGSSNEVGGPHYLTLTAKDNTNFTGAISDIPYYIYQPTEVSWTQGISGINRIESYDEAGETEQPIASGEVIRGKLQDILVKSSFAEDVPYTLNVECEFTTGVSSAFNKTYTYERKGGDDPMRLSVPCENGIYASSIKISASDYMTLKFDDITTNTDEAGNLIAPEDNALFENNILSHVRFYYDGDTSVSYPYTNTLLVPKGTILYRNGNCLELNYYNPVMKNNHVFSFFVDYGGYYPNLESEWLYNSYVKEHYAFDGWDDEVIVTPEHNATYSLHRLNPRYLLTATPDSHIYNVQAQFANPDNPPSYFSLHSISSNNKWEANTELIIIPEDINATYSFIVRNYNTQEVVDRLENVKGVFIYNMQDYDSEIQLVPYGPLTFTDNTSYKNAEGNVVAPEEIGLDGHYSHIEYWNSITAEWVPYNNNLILPPDVELEKVDDYNLRTKVDNVTYQFMMVMGDTWTNEEGAEVDSAEHVNAHFTFDGFNPKYTGTTVEYVLNRDVRYTVSKLDDNRPLELTIPYVAKSGSCVLQANDTIYEGTQVHARDFNGASSFTNPALGYSVFMYNAPDTTNPIGEYVNDYDYETITDLGFDFTMTNHNITYRILPFVNVKFTPNPEFERMPGIQAKLGTEEYKDYTLGEGSENYLYLPYGTVLNAISTFMEPNILYAHVDKVVDVSGNRQLTDCDVKFRVNPNVEHFSFDGWDKATYELNPAGDPTSWDPYVFVINYKVTAENAYTVTIDADSLNYINTIKIDDNLPIPYTTPVQAYEFDNVTVNLNLDFPTTYGYSFVITSESGTTIQHYEKELDGLIVRNPSFEMPAEDVTISIIPFVPVNVDQFVDNTNPDIAYAGSKVQRYSVSNNAWIDYDGTQIIDLPQDMKLITTDDNEIIASFNHYKGTYTTYFRIVSKDAAFKFNKWSQDYFTVSEDAQYSYNLTTKDNNYELSVDEGSIAIDSIFSKCFDPTCLLEDNIYRYQTTAVDGKWSHAISGDEIFVHRGDNSRYDTLQVKYGSEAYPEYMYIPMPANVDTVTFYMPSSDVELTLIGNLPISFEVQPDTAEPCEILYSESTLGSWETYTDGDVSVPFGTKFRVAEGTTDVLNAYDIGNPAVVMCQFKLNPQPTSSYLYAWGTQEITFDGSDIKYNAETKDGGIIFGDKASTTALASIGINGAEPSSDYPIEVYNKQEIDLYAKATGRYVVAIVKTDASGINDGDLIASFRWLVTDTNKPYAFEFLKATFGSYSKVFVNDISNETLFTDETTFSSAEYTPATVQYIVGTETWVDLPDQKASIPVGAKIQKSTLLFADNGPTAPEVLEVNYHGKVVSLLRIVKNDFAVANHRISGAIEITSVSQEVKYEMPLKQPESTLHKIEYTDSSMYKKVWGKDNIDVEAVEVLSGHMAPEGAQISFEIEDGFKDVALSLEYSFAPLFSEKHYVELAPTGQLPDIRTTEMPGWHVKYGNMYSYAALTFKENADIQSEQTHVEYRSLVAPGQWSEWAPYNNASPLLVQQGLTLYRQSNKDLLTLTERARAGESFAKSYEFKCVNDSAFWICDGWSQPQFVTSTENVFTYNVHEITDTKVFALNELLPTYVSVAKIEANGCEIPIVGTSTKTVELPLGTEITLTVNNNDNGFSLILSDEGQELSDGKYIDVPASAKTVSFQISAASKELTDIISVAPYFKVLVKPAATETQTSNVFLSITGGTATQYDQKMYLPYGVMFGRYEDSGISHMFAEYSRAESYRTYNFNLDSGFVFSNEQFMVGESFADEPTCVMTYEKIPNKIYFDENVDGLVMVEVINSQGPTYYIPGTHEFAEVKDGDIVNLMVFNKGTYIFDIAYKDNDETTGMKENFTAEDETLTTAYTFEYNQSLTDLIVYFNMYKDVNISDETNVNFKNYEGAEYTKAEISVKDGDPLAWDSPSEIYQIASLPKGAVLKQNVTSGQIIATYRDEEITIFDVERRDFAATDTLQFIDQTIDDNYSLNYTMQIKEPKNDLRKIVYLQSEITDIWATDDNVRWFSIPSNHVLPKNTEITINSAAVTSKCSLAYSVDDETVDKYIELPEPSTDYIYSVVMPECDSVLNLKALLPYMELHFAPRVGSPTNGAVEYSINNGVSWNPYNENEPIITQQNLSAHWLETANATDKSILVLDERGNNAKHYWFRCKSVSASYKCDGWSSSETFTKFGETIKYELSTFENTYKVIVGSALDSLEISKVLINGQEIDIKTDPVESYKYVEIPKNYPVQIEVTGNTQGFSAYVWNGDGEALENSNFYDQPSKTANTLDVQLKDSDISETTFMILEPYFKINVAPNPNEEVEGASTVKVKIGDDDPVPYDPALNPVYLPVGLKFTRNDVSNSVSEFTAVDNRTNPSIPVTYVFSLESTFMWSDSSDPVGDNWEKISTDGLAYSLYYENVPVEHKIYLDTASTTDLKGIQVDDGTIVRSGYATAFKGNVVKLYVNGQADDTYDIAIVSNDPKTNVDGELIHYERLSATASGESILYSFSYPLEKDGSPANCDYKIYVDRVVETHVFDKTDISSYEGAEYTSATIYKYNEDGASATPLEWSDGHQIAYLPYGATIVDLPSSYDNAGGHTPKDFCFSYHGALIQEEYVVERGDFATKEYTIEDNVSVEYDSGKQKLEYIMPLKPHLHKLNFADKNTSKIDSINVRDSYDVNPSGGGILSAVANHLYSSTLNTTLDININKDDMVWGVPYSLKVSDEADEITYIEYPTTVDPGYDAGYSINVYMPDYDFNIYAFLPYVELDLSVDEPELFGDKSKIEWSDDGGYTWHDISTFNITVQQDCELNLVAEENNQIFWFLERTRDGEEAQKMFAFKCSSTDAYIRCNGWNISEGTKTSTDPITFTLENVDKTEQTLFFTGLREFTVANAQNGIKLELTEVADTGWKADLPLGIPLLFTPIDWNPEDLENGYALALVYNPSTPTFDAFYQTEEGGVPLSFICNEKYIYTIVLYPYGFVTTSKVGSTGSEQTVYCQIDDGDTFEYNDSTKILFPPFVHFTYQSDSEKNIIVCEDALDAASWNKIKLWIENTSYIWSSSALRYIGLDENWNNYVLNYELNEYNNYSSDEQPEADAQSDDSGKIDRDKDMNFYDPQAENAGIDFAAIMEPINDLIEALTS